MSTQVKWSGLGSSRPLLWSVLGAETVCMCVYVCVCLQDERGQGWTDKVWAVE